jgi:hypothetical protein
MRYEVIVAGTIHSVHNTKAEAELQLDLIRNSFLAMVHPKDSFYIKEVVDN